MSGRNSAHAVVIAAAVALIQAAWADVLQAAPNWCLASAASQTATQPQQHPSSALVAELLAWIGGNSSYDITRTLLTPPDIRFCSTGQIIDYEHQAIIVDKDLRAAYDLDRRRIYLVAPWDPARLEDQAVLLHELIHDVQHLNRTWDCKQQPEYEAYRLQSEWLKARGLPVPFDLAQIFIRSRCKQPRH